MKDSLPTKRGRKATGRELTAPRASQLTLDRLRLLAEHWTAQKGRSVSTAEAQEIAIERAVKALLKPSH